MNTKQTLIMELEGIIKHQSSKAILFIFDDLDGKVDPLTDNIIIREEWFPLSQVYEIHHDTPNRIVISEWIYKQKELTWK